MGVARRAMAGAAVTWAMVLILCSLCCLSTSANAQVDCGAQLDAMQSCIDYVNNNTAAPPSKACCTAFNSTQVSKPVCLCQLQQSFADPATAPGNVTRVNLIPSLCAVSVDPSKCPTLLGLAPVPAPAVVATPPTVATPPGDVDCSNEFDSLSSCITYVTSGDTTPPATCCSSLLSVHVNKPVCLCQLLQGVNADPSASAGLNVTKALELPKTCKVDGADVKNCPALLGQPVASPSDAPLGSALSPDQSATSPAESGEPGASPIPPEATPDVTAPPNDDNGVMRTAGPASILLCIASLALHCLV